MWRRLLEFVSSMKLTIVCLAAALVLVFAGTMAQVNYGLHEVQTRYFQSLLVWWPPGEGGFRIPVFPGGHLIGGVLLFNLIAAHIRRFSWTWRKLGIQLTHLGLIVMLGGGLFTDLFSRESFMRLGMGETKNFSEDSLRMELALIDETDPATEQVTSIPESRLVQGGTISDPSLPFQVVVRQFFKNAQLQPLDKAGPGARVAATQGVGAQVAATGIPPVTAMNERDAAAAVIEIVPASGGSLGTWLVSEVLGAPQTFSTAGKKWRLAFRSARYYKPFSLTLRKFTHERYAGTEISKNFASRVTLTDPDRGENREVLIYMNHPLRYRGDTYYQSGFEKDDQATVLQVVHNPTFVAPYIACLIVGAGLLMQFGYHFIAFLRRKKSNPA